MITSFFPGHLRLRSPALKDAAIAERLVSILQRFPATKHVDSNAVTGSIVLEYNAAQVPIEKLQPLLPVFEKLEKTASNYSEKTKPTILTLVDELEEHLKKLQ